MALNSLKILKACISRESGPGLLRTVYFSPVFSGSSCYCSVQSSRLNQFRYFKRDLRISASILQLSTSPSTKPKETIGPVTAETKVGVIDHGTKSELRELFRRQKERLLEEPDEEKPHVIYKGILAGTMKRVKVLSITSSVAGLMMQPLLYQNSGEVPMLANVALFGFIAFFTYVTPFLIHSLTKKYVTEMIYDPQKDLYTAATYSFFLRRREAVFKVEDIKVPDVPGPFTTFLYRNKEGKNVPLFVAPEAFLDHSHYGRLMGYDKPIDLRLKTTGENKDKNISDRNK